MVPTTLLVTDELETSCPGVFAINMEGGSVSTAIYGGANTNGVLKLDATLNITGGTVGTTSSDSTNTSMSNDSEHNGRIHGNIGVTTSQQMLEAELNLGYWNVYTKITELFLQEFTIPVYE